MLKTLNARILLTVTGIVCFTVAVSMLIVQWQTTSIVQNIQKTNAENLVSAITLVVENEYHSIQFHRQATLDLRKEELKNVVDIAYSVLTEYSSNSLSGYYDLGNAQHLAKQTIKKMRWADDVGYFWINDTTTPIPKMIMHPTLPELDGTVLDNPVFDCALGSNGNLFRAANLVTKAEGSGYVDYLWPKPTAEGQLTDKQPKLSFVRLFEPWQWIIGSGVYLDDIKAETQERLQAVLTELRNTSQKIHIGENGYMFMFTSEKKILIHPDLQGQDGSELLNPDTGMSLVDEIILAEKTANKTLEYSWRKPTGDKNELFVKKLYVSYFEPLDWYICVSYYQDEVNQPVKDLGWRMMVLVVIVIVIAIILSFLLGRSLTAPLNKLSSAAEIIAQQGIGAAEIPISGSKETCDLGSILSQTLTTIGEKERSLRESEKKLRIAEKDLKDQLTFTQSLLLALPAPIFFKDAEGKYLGCNQAFSDFVGVSIEQVKGKTSFDLWPKDCAGEYHQIDMELLSTSVPQSVDLQVLDANGQKHDVIFNNAVFRDDKGNVAGLVGSFLDISKRLEAEKTIRESELKYRQLVENANDAIFIAQDGYVKFSNSKTSMLTGYDAEELKGVNLVELIHPDDRDMVGERHRRRSQGEKGLPDTYSFRMLHRDDIEHTILLSTASIEWNDKPAVLCCARDITEQKKLETALFQAQKMDAIGQLAGGIAHDFNNMLSGILGAAQLLKSTGKKLDTKETDYADLIIKSVKRAADLTSKLLAFGYKGKITSQLINMHKIIDDAHDILKRTIDKKIKFIVEKNADNFTAIGDKSAMQNALMNLGINASHSMPGGGVVHIKTRNVKLTKSFCDASQFDIEPGAFIDIEFQDAGEGIPKENMEKIFEPFFTTKMQGKGTGLGLAAAYGTIRDHHGAITVYSEVGIGTVFHIYLPCSEKHVWVKKGDDKVITGTGTILFVDDEEILRFTGKHQLEDMGYDVLVAENGKEGLEIFQHHHSEIDLVLMDMIMPEMNGSQAFVQMKKIDPNCKVIIASGFTKSEDLEKLWELGLAGFLHKPASDYELSKLLAENLLETKD